MKAMEQTSRSGAGKGIQPLRPAHIPTPFEEADRWFENFFPRGWLRPLRTEWPAWGEMAAPFQGRMPNVDVIDRDDEVIVRAEVPGVEKRDLDVSVADNVVTIRGEAQREEKEETGDYYCCEISQGAFVRTVALPESVDTEGAKATFQDGVLELTLPKVAKAKRRTLKID